MKLLWILFPLLVLSSCGSTGNPADEKVRYVCQCVSGCNCGTVSNKPGKCKCGEYLIPD